MTTIDSARVLADGRVSVRLDDGRRVYAPTVDDARRFARLLPQCAGMTDYSPVGAALLLAAILAPTGDAADATTTHAARVA